MLKKLLTPFVLLFIGYFVITSENIKIIFTGVAIFIIGMFFMENGFKLFSGGTLEKVLERFTKNRFTSILIGFVSTSIVQSSSLISVIVISFLSVELISLIQGLGIVFGANLGSTTTAWIVSSFGLNLKISLYAMPMIIFGVIFRFSKNNSYIGIGNILLGLGFVFLGISYMKDGFDSLKGAIDLASYSVGGVTGIFIYILIGAIATIIIQSSGATMAIIITALAGDNILYLDALALAIGSNIGTTATAVLGSLTSNDDGKRLAFGHFIFNIITGLIAIVLIYQLKDFVDFIAPYFAIEEENYSMKLALFHTVFNLLGVVVLFPFMALIVRLSQRVIKSKKIKESKARYLDKANIKIPYNAMVSIHKEVIHLYDNAQKAILHAMGVHTTELNSKEDIKKVVNKISKIDTNLDDVYQKDLKSLYGQIIDYAYSCGEGMTKEQIEFVGELKLSSSIIIKILKDTRDIQKNMNIYLYSENEYIKNEYLNIKEGFVSNIFEVNQLEDIDDIDTLTQIEMNKESLSQLDILNNKKIDELIRSHKITPSMATSLINDYTTALNINRNLFRVANTLFIDSKNIRKLGENNESK